MRPDLARHGRFFAATPSLLALALLGCATQRIPVRPAAIPHGARQAPILFSPPMALANPDDAVVRVVGPEMTCSGTLIDDDLVLTAHHCVVKKKAGALTREPLAATDLQVELGGDYLAWGTVRPRAVVVPPCGWSGGAGDLAVLVLERKLVGMSTMTPRLDKPPRMGEPLDPVGFGRCALSPDGIHRHDLAGGDVVATTQETFVLQASICPGDSGGPVRTRGTHEVVGVVSQSAMDGDEHTKNVTILARIDAYRSVFAAARQIADGADPRELPPLACPP